MRCKIANFSECTDWTVYICNCYYQKFLFFYFLFSKCYYQKLIVLTFNCDLTLIICNPYKKKKKIEQKWTWYLYDFIVLDLSRSKYSPWNVLYQWLLIKLIKRIIIGFFFLIRKPLLCSMVTVVMDYGQQIEWIARYIGQRFFYYLISCNSFTCKLKLFNISMKN